MMAHTGTKSEIHWVSLMSEGWWVEKNEGALSKANLARMKNSQTALNCLHRSLHKSAHKGEYFSLWTSLKNNNHLAGTLQQSSFRRVPIYPSVPRIPNSQNFPNFCMCRNGVNSKAKKSSFALQIKLRTFPLPLMQILRPSL